MQTKSTIWTTPRADMTTSEMIKTLKAMNAEKAAADAEHVNDMVHANRYVETLLDMTAAMLAEMMKRDGDRLEGDGYISRKDLAEYFDVSSATITAWGQDLNFPSPLGGWDSETKRMELKFWKAQVRQWRAMMHGIEPDRAAKIFAAAKAMQGEAPAEKVPG